MVRSYKNMRGSCVKAIDGEAGNLKDIYFDDLGWRVHYFVVTSSSWFSNHDVLVPPSAVCPFEGHFVNIELTKAELKECPVAESAIPVSLRQQNREQSFVNLLCTGGSALYGGPLMAPLLMPEISETSDNDPHLKSCKSISEYEITGLDGKLGDVEDVLIDDASWIVRYITIHRTKESGMELNTVLCSSQSIESIEETMAALKVGSTKEMVATLPQFNSMMHLDTSYESLVRHLYDCSSHGQTG